jgi:hypothetical protein
MLDIGLPQSSPRRSHLRCPHPAASRDLHQIVGPPCGGPTNTASPGTRSPFEYLSAPTAVSPLRNVPCPLPLEVCNSSGYVGDLSSFTDPSLLIRSYRETPSIALSIVLCVTSRLGSVQEAMQHILGLKTKVFNSCVLPVMTYGTETWPLTMCHIRRLNVTQRAKVKYNYNYIYYAEKHRKEQKRKFTQEIKKK